MRRVELKSDVFEGYILWIDLSKYKNIDDICAFCKVHLVNFLKTFNLKNLINYANKMKLYNNMYISYEDMLARTSENDTLYIYEKLQTRGSFIAKEAD